MYVEFRDMITALSGLLRLIKVRRTPPSKTPHLTSAFDMLRNFQTKCIYDIESMGNVSMYLWKMPLKYGGMILSSSWPLGLPQYS